MKKKDLEKLIEKTYYKYGSGVQINIMTIPKIFREATTAYQSGRDLDEVIQELISKYREN